MRNVWTWKLYDKTRIHRPSLTRIYPQGKLAIGISMPRFIPPSARDDERLAFYGVISIRKDDWGSHQPTCDTVVTVYHSCKTTEERVNLSEGLILRAVVYYIKQASYAEVLINGLEELRQVIYFSLSTGFQCLNLTVLKRLHFEGAFRSTVEI